MSKIVYVLWTGGWDSTFRILQLQKKKSEEKIIIQPIYVSDDSRKSEIKEIEAIKKITTMTRNIGSNELMDLKIIEKSEIALAI